MNAPLRSSFIRRHWLTFVAAAVVFGGLGYAVFAAVQTVRSAARRTSDA